MPSLCYKGTHPNVPHHEEVETIVVPVVKKVVVRMIFHVQYVCLKLWCGCLFIYNNFSSRPLNKTGGLYEADIY